MEHNNRANFFKYFDFMNIFCSGKFIKACRDGYTHVMEGSGVSATYLGDA